MFHTLFLLLLLLPTLVLAQALDRTHIAYRNPLQHGATCDATTLNAAITAISTAKETLFITRTDRAKVNCTWTLASNVTTNANTTLYIPTGVVISINTGITLTLNGPNIVDSFSSAFTGLGTVVINGPLTAPPQRLFDSDVTATFTANKLGTSTVYAEWWGAVGDGTTDSTTAIQRAINAVNTRNGGCVKLNAGRYRITDTIQILGDYSAVAYPDVLVVGIGLCGAGANATFIEWNSTLQLQTVRKAMVLLGGNYVRLEDLTLISPRRYSSIVAGFSIYNTPYYGIVMRTTATWKVHIRNVNIFFTHVGISAGIIKNFANAGNGLEFEPTSGGTAMALDFAQLAMENVRIDARTQEFFDGTLNRGTQNNANGTNLSRGVGHTTDLTGATFSDGSYAIELGTQQTVNVTCRTCTLRQENINVNGTIRVHNAGNILFDKSIILAPPPDGDYSFGLFEKIDSGGSNVVFDGAYFMGGIYKGASSQGSILIKNSDGENSVVEAFNGEVRLFTPLDGVAIRAVIIVDGLRLGRGSQIKSVQLSAGVQGANPVAPFGTNAAFSDRVPRFVFRGVEGVTNWLWGHEALTGSPLARFNPARNIIPANVPAVLRGKVIVPTFLHQSLYEPIPGGGAANFTDSRYIEGLWHFMASSGVTHVYAPLARVDATTAVNVCVNAYVLMVAGHPTSELSDDLSIVIRFYNTAKVAIGTGLSLLGSFTPTNNYTLLSNGRSVKLCNYHIIPPTGTMYIGLILTSTPVAARTQEVGFGNIEVLPAPAEVAVEGIAPTLYAATAAPTTGTWAVGDRVANSAPAVGTPKGWLCTVAGTPGTWVSEGNL